MNFSRIKKILVLGLGRSGCAAARLARVKGFEVIAIDEAESVSLLQQKCDLEKEGVIVYLGYKNDFLPHSDIVIISPGISEYSFLGKAALNSEATIISEIEFALHYISKPVIAITGTNGKTTVTELCTHVLKNLGMKVVFAGNIGVPFSDIARNEINCDFIVLEISSFQLHYCTEFKPHIAVILNVESDHIDWHGSFETYAEDKFKIGANQKKDDFLIVNEYLLPLIGKSKYKPLGKIQTISVKNKNALLRVSENVIFFGNNKVCSLRELGKMGENLHNIENSLACIAVCKNLGFEFKEIIKSFKGFETGEHRLEFVGKKNGIKFINDSKSTNPLSVTAALEAFEGNNNVCLIAGGLDKDMDFSSVLEHKKKIKKIFLVGKSKNKLENLFRHVIDYAIFDLFEQSVNAACDCAESGDIVLLSPGCASMDMFKDYIERGNFFKEIIKRRYFENEGVKKGSC